VENLGDIAKKILIAYSVIILTVIYFPIAMIIVLSFNDSQNVGLQFSGFSLRWYVGQTGFQGIGGFLNDSQLLTALSNSLYVALFVSLVTTILTLLTSLSIRYRFRGRNLLFYIFLSGLFIPGVLYGFGTEFIYHQFDIIQNILAVVPVQVVYAMPFGILLLLPRFDREMETYEDAARVLGANRWNVFTRITFPMILYQVIGVAMFSFAISWGELTRTAFVSSGTGTLPVYLFARLQTLAPTPELYAVGTVITAVAICAVLAGGILLTRQRKRLI
jgi:ABC-type spermidine/putrescine transport system permease subunit II